MLDLEVEYIAHYTHFWPKVENIKESIFVSRAKITEHRVESCIAHAFMQLLSSLNRVG